MGPARFPKAFVPAASLPRLAGAALAVGGAGLACVAYGVLVERRWFRLQRYELPLLPTGATGPLTVLHLSDLHMTRGQERMRRFLASLPRPDLLVATGDLVGEPEAVETVVAALRPLRGRLGSYVVLGSNDYFAPRPVNYAWYFLRERPRHRRAVQGRAPELVAQLEADGWTHLRNRKTSLRAAGTRLEVLGLDDAHIARHDMRAAPRTDPEAFGMVVTHSPDPAPELAALGYDLIVAGHTHGGQVRLPVVGAIVTNGHMPNRLAMGLSSIPPAVMHISPGLGTSKYAPFRFLCRPEATVLELVPRAAPA